MIKFGVTKTSEKESADELSVVVRKGFHIYIYKLCIYQNLYMLLSRDNGVYP